MRSWICSSLVALLAACNDARAPANPAPVPASHGVVETGAPAPAPPARCDAIVASIVPASGDVMVPLGQGVAVRFDEVVTPTDTHSISIEGVAGATTLAGDGLSMTFTPDVPFEPSTTYTVHVEVCADADSATFTTEPEVPIDNVEGKVYALRWADLAFTEPGAPEALDLIPIDSVLLQIESVDPLTGVAPSAATVGLAGPAGEAVPECDTVTEAEADFSLNPYYAFEGNLQLTLDPGAVPPLVAEIQEFRLHARVAPDGASLSEITVHALVAPEQFLAGLDCENGLIQALLAPTCLPCTSSDTGRCMLLEGSADRALVEAGLDLVESCGL